MNTSKNMKKNNNSTSHLIKEESSAVNSILFPYTPFVNQGWQCPICGRVYSPSTPMCFYCGNKETSISTSTSTSI